MSVALSKLMHRGVAEKLALFLVSVLAGPAVACRVQYCAQHLAPADRQLLPANARALITMGHAETRWDPVSGDPIFWTPWINRLNADGGVQPLLSLPAEIQPSGTYGNATLFDPGPLVAGEQFRLESSIDCSAPPTVPSAEVLVIDAEPLPTAIGTVFSPPSLRVDPTGQYTCGPSSPFIEREIFLDVDDSVRPWLGVARVNLEVNGKSQSTAYGGLARGFDGGSRVVVERLTRLCLTPITGEPSTSLETWNIKLELELPGVTERPPAVEFPVEMDCRPSCAAVGVGPWLLAALALGVRRKSRR